MGKTYREIGDTVNRSVNQVSVIERQALRRLRGSTKQRLAEFYDFNFFRGVGLGSFQLHFCFLLYFVASEPRKPVVQSGFSSKVHRDRN